MRQASRIVRMKPADIKSDVLKSLIPEDFVMPDELQHKATYRTIGFAS